MIKTLHFPTMKVEYEMDMNKSMYWAGYKIYSPLDCNLLDYSPFKGDLQSLSGFLRLFSVSTYKEWFSFGK